MNCETMGTLESQKGVISIMVLAKEVSLGWHPPVPRRAPGAGPNRKRGTFPMGFQSFCTSDHTDILPEKYF